MTGTLEEKLAQLDAALAKELVARLDRQNKERIVRMIKQQTMRRIRREAHGGKLGQALAAADILGDDFLRAYKHLFE